MSVPLRELVPDMVRAYEAGATHQQIADALGCSREYVRQLIGEQSELIREQRRAAKRRTEVYAEVDRTIARMKRQAHGTVRRYQMGCRCDHCRTAKRERYYAWRDRVTPEDASEHGTPATYTNYRCRCKPCTRAWSAHCADYQRRRREEAAA